MKLLLNIIICFLSLIIYKTYCQENEFLLHFTTCDAFLKEIDVRAMRAANTMRRMVLKSELLYSEELVQTAFYHLQDMRFHGAHHIACNSPLSWSDTRPHNVQWESCCGQHSMEICTYDKTWQITQDSRFKPTYQITLQANEELICEEQVLQLYLDNPDKMAPLLQTDNFHAVFQRYIGAYVDHNIVTLMVTATHGAHSPCTSPHIIEPCDERNDAVEETGVFLNIFRRDRMETRKVGNLRGGSVFVPLQDVVEHFEVNDNIIK